MNSEKDKISSSLHEENLNAITGGKTSYNEDLLSGYNREGLIAKEEEYRRKVLQKTKDDFRRKLFGTL